MFPSALRCGRLLVGQVQVGQFGEDVLTGIVESRGVAKGW